MAKRKPVTRPVHKIVAYYPPPREVIDNFAREVCQQLGQKVDAGFNTPEMVWGFASFIKIVAVIYAKHLSKPSDPSTPLDI
ncbi:MAG: hypothetical protein ABI947_23070 [Chloroflexota bacterium]